MTRRAVEEHLCLSLPLPWSRTTVIAAASSRQRGHHWGTNHAGRIVSPQLCKILLLMSELSKFAEPTCLLQVVVMEVTGAGTLILMIYIHKCRRLFDDSLHQNYWYVGPLFWYLLKLFKDVTGRVFLTQCIKSRSESGVIVSVVTVQLVQRRTLRCRRVAVWTTKTQGSATMSSAETLSPTRRCVKTRRCSPTQTSSSASTTSTFNFTPVCRVSATPGNLLRVEIAHGNPGNLLEFSWCCWKILW